MINDTIITQYTVWRVILNVEKAGISGETWKERTLGVVLAAAFLFVVARFAGAFFTSVFFLTVVFFEVAICFLEMNL